MTHTVLIHLLNEEPVVAEVENVPEPGDQVLMVSNVRRRDGREVHDHQQLGVVGAGEDRHRGVVVGV